MASDAPGSPPLRLHVGCGPQHLDGWVNVDLHEGPGVDRALDVRDGLPFSGVETLYAEHFLEHLALDEALAFLRAAWRALLPGGVLRLSTPNLDWVVATQYAQRLGAEPAAAALGLNRGFHAWSHRFLWNRALLAEVLAACGFVDLRWHAHGESARPHLAGLEHHERYDDAAGLPHVLVVEATRGDADEAAFARLRARCEQAFLADARPVGWRIDPSRSEVVVELPLAGPLGRLLGRHVIRACWVGGALQVVPEAPEETRVEVDVDTRHLALDDPGERSLRRLRPLPEPLRRALERRLRGARGLDVEALQTIAFVATRVDPVEPGRVRVEGTLRVGAREVPFSPEALVGHEGSARRARSRAFLSWAALGLRPWRALGGLVRGTDALTVDLALVAEPVLPT